MKKVRFMLLAIAVIAIAGGTLAFKAKYNLDICTAAATFDPQQQTYTCQLGTFTATCTVLLSDVDTFEPGEEDIPVCYTETLNDECRQDIIGADCGLISTNPLEGAD